VKKAHTIFRIGLIFLGLLTGRSYGHDFWLEAHPFYTESGKTVDLSIHVGNEFVGDSLPNIASWYTDFSLYSAQSKKDIEGELGRDPAGFFTPSQPGTNAIGYQSTFSYVELDSATFNKYLDEEGLNNAIKYRQDHGQNKSQGNENYIRHAKALVQAGDQFKVDYSQLNLGYDLEIIPLSNPYQKNLNDKLSVKILYKNKPARDILLSAFSRVKPDQIQHIRSNSDGIARIRLNQSGDWLLKAVKILKIDDDKADWQSHWASLTFSIHSN